MHTNLIGEMAKRSISINAIANVLGIHRNSVRNKLYGISDFSLKEACRIYDQFFADCDFRWLFDTVEILDGNHTT